MRRSDRADDDVARLGLAAWDGTAAEVAQFVLDSCQILPLQVVIGRQPLGTDVHRRRGEADAVESPFGAPSLRAEAGADKRPGPGCDRRAAGAHAVPP